MSQRCYWEIYLRIVWHTKRNFPFLVDRKQKEHHARGTTIARLEATDGEGLKPESRKPLEAALEDLIIGPPPRRYRRRVLNPSGMAAEAAQSHFTDCKID